MNNEMQQFNDVPAYTAGNLPPKPVEAGVIQANNQHYTAMKVQVPRDLAKIKNEMLMEAKMAKEKFYYSLPWGARIEGPSIGMAKSLARTFGNCLLDMQVETKQDSWLFKAFFIDLEKGYCVSKLFSQPRKINLGKKFDKNEENRARRDNIAFQIGQSKALRNVIILAMPEWLISDTFDTAKAATLNDSAGERGEVSKVKAIKYFESRDITVEQLEVFLGNRKSDSWVASDIAKLRELLQSVKENIVALSDIFPPEKETPPEPEKAELPKAKPQKVKKVAKKPVVSQKSEEVPKLVPEKVNAGQSYELVEEAPELVPEEANVDQPSNVSHELSDQARTTEQEATMELHDLYQYYPKEAPEMAKKLRGQPPSLIVAAIKEKINNNGNKPPKAVADPSKQQEITI